MTPRPYRDGGDLEALQDFTATAIAQHGHLGFLHPGDIPHRIYNGLRHDDPSELVHIWEDDDGLILGWVFLHPRGGWFEPQISPEARSVHSGLECEMLEWAEARLRISMTAGGFAKEHLVTAVSENDGMRVALLAERGWELGQLCAHSPGRSRGRSWGAGRWLPGSYRERCRGSGPDL